VHQALDLDNGNVKALYWRARAKEKQSLYDAALVDAKVRAGEREGGREVRRTGGREGALLHVTSASSPHSARPSWSRCGERRRR
jgi:hypothetical protein